ncbi:MAG: LysE family translocator [Gilvibacter sp.]
MAENLYYFVLATLTLAMSPGPDNIYVLSQGLSNGYKYGIATTAGLISGCIVHTTLLAFGMSAIIAASPTIFWTIKIAGACYLLYLAFKVWRSHEGIKLGEKANKMTYSQLFWQGVIMNLVNPKVIIFFLAFFPGFLWDLEGNTVMQFYILGGTFMITSFIVFSAIAILAGKLSEQLQKKQHVATVFKWLQIVVFVGIAVFILLPDFE